MARLFYHVMQDNAGNLLFDVSGTMRLAGTGTIATIYGDEALTVILPNPMTNHASFGSFKCFLPPGDYDFYMAKSGYTFETLTGVQGAGTMADQNAYAVAITGGTVLGLTDAQSNRFLVPHRDGNNVIAFNSELSAAGGTGRFGLYLVGTAQAYINSQLGIQGFPLLAAALTLRWAKATQSGVYCQPTDSDTGGAALTFANVAGTGVGTITTTAAATAYNTTSDARLKFDVEDLPEALAVVQALRPVAFRWKLDDSVGHGFLANEVQEVVGGVITGEPDAVDDEGRILPQMIDYSKLVPYLVGAIKELTTQVEILTARCNTVSV